MQGQGIVSYESDNTYAEFDFVLVPDDYNLTAQDMVVLSASFKEKGAPLTEADVDEIMAIHRNPINLAL